MNRKMQALAFVGRCVGRADSGLTRSITHGAERVPCEKSILIKSGGQRETRKAGAHLPKKFAARSMTEASLEREVRIHIVRAVAWAARWPLIRSADL